ncbi:MAG: hypothetical protein KJ971_00235 [Firmicutes bacterium]|nr:hypothetical protein [Bacillota bacterium]
MNSLIKLHLYYLINRISLFLILFFSLIVFIVLLYNSNFEMGYTVLDASRTEYALNYYQESILIITLISILFSVFLHLNAFSQQTNRFAFYIVDSKKAKLNYVVSKQIALMIINFIFILNQFFLFLIIGEVLTPFFMDWNQIFSLFWMVFIQASLFGLLQVYLMYLIHHIFTGIIPILLFWLIEAISSFDSLQTQKLFSTFQIVFPHISYINNQYNLAHSMLYYIIVLCIFIVFEFALYLSKDIN